MSDEGESDKTLEDFFAKKSKGKKKAKSKSKAFTTSQDIADKKQQTKSKAEEKVEAAPKVVSQVCVYASLPCLGCADVVQPGSAAPCTTLMQDGLLS